jgi:hypothetical protein
VQHIIHIKDTRVDLVQHIIHIKDTRIDLVQHIIHIKDTRVDLLHLIINTKYIFTDHSTLYTFFEFYSKELTQKENELLTNKEIELKPGLLYFYYFDY